MKQHIYYKRRCFLFFRQKIIKIGILANPCRSSCECLYLSKVGISFFFYAKFQVFSTTSDCFREESKYTPVPYQPIVYQTKKGIKVKQCHCKFKCKSVSKHCKVFDKFQFDCTFNRLFEEELFRENFDTICLLRRFKTFLLVLP